MSAQAAVCIAAVLLVWALHAPRGCVYALWSVVLFRLLCPPISFKSAFSAAALAYQAQNADLRIRIELGNRILARHRAEAE